MNNITAENLKNDNLAKSLLKILSENLNKTNIKPHGKDFACCNVPNVVIHV